MSSVLCLTVRFLDPVPAFHGRGDGGDSEWPPSPLRVFQSLVAAASAKWIGSEFINFAVPALHWLEQQGEPTILVPGIQSQRTGFRMYVPNNATDLVTAKWARGDFAATIAEHRVEKDVLPTRFLTSDTIYFLWELPDILPADFNAQAFVHVFDTRLEEGLVRDDPFILKPGVSFNLMARSMAVFQHSADAKS